MNNYTIYCTEEQTKKAFELGAKIEIQEYCPLGEIEPDWFHDEDKCYHIPTAEQMIGWLEEQKSIKEVSIYCDVTGSNWSFDGYKDNGSYAFASRDSYYSRKEATIAAIDTALDYLDTK